MDSAILVAIIGALSVFIFLESLLSLGLGVFGKKKLLDRLKAEEKREVPFIFRLLSPLAEDLSKLGGLRRSVGKDAKEIRKAGYPFPSVGDFYALKAFLAISFFFVGIGINLLLGAPTCLLPPLLLGLLGLFLPDIKLSRSMRRRRELLRTEMAFSLDRMALLAEAGLAIQVIFREISASPGGLFTRSLGRVIEDMDLGEHPREAFKKMKERLPDCDELDKFIDRVLSSIERGAPIAQSLKALGETMRTKINSEAMRRGMRTTLLISTVGVVFILTSLMIVAIFPLFYTILEIF